MQSSPHARSHVVASWHVVLQSSAQSPWQSTRLSQSATQPGTPPHENAHVLPPAQ
jgi:hypothetical protein